MQPAATANPEEAGESNPDEHSYSESRGSAVHKLVRLTAKPPTTGSGCLQSLDHAGSGEDYAEPARRHQDSLHRVKLLRNPLSEAKYIGMVTAGHLSSNTTILCSELELIIVSALDMYAFFKRFMQILGENAFGEFQVLRGAGSSS